MKYWPKRDKRGNSLSPSDKIDKLVVELDGKSFEQVMPYLSGGVVKASNTKDCTKRQGRWDISTLF